MKKTSSLHSLGLAAQSTPSLGVFVTLDRPDLIPFVPKEARGIELRLDLFPTMDIAKLENAISSSPFPILLTLRKPSHGGEFPGTETARMTLIKRLLLLKPCFFDLECDMDPHFIKEVIFSYPDIGFIISYHNYKETPSDIEEIYKNMFREGAFAYKIATFANSVNDALRLLILSKKHPDLSTIAMGEKGSFTRAIGSTLENKIGYAYLTSKEALAPGQLSLKELIEFYRYGDSLPEANLYGLIGNPVESSLGHIYHNKRFEEKGQNALYVKMTVSENELTEFIPLAKKAGFKGLSVTAPLKEKILPHVDITDPGSEKIGSVNTLAFTENSVIGANFDGQGALDAVEESTYVKGKRLVIIGAGGTAKSVAFEAKKRGAFVLIAGRTNSKAEELAAWLECEFSDISDIPTDYDILINTTPSPLPIDPTKIIASALVMDVTYNPKHTLFLQKALEAGCKVIYGEEMFVRQARKQSEFWDKKKPLR